MNLEEIRNKFEQEMIDNGYRPFSKNPYRSALNGIKYFITIWHYNHSESLSHLNIVSTGDSYSPDCQFEIEGNVHINVEYLGNLNFKTSEEGAGFLEKVEAFYENVFNKLNCLYYERWD